MEPVNRRAIIVVAVLAMASATLLVIDDQLGPLAIETSGVVTGASVKADEYGHNWKMISVRLKDGSIVEAKAPEACIVFPGDPVQLQGLRSMYSATRSYLYLGAKGKDET